MNLVNQLAAICSENTILLSVDNKMKVEIGNPATSRRSQIRRFFLVEDAPNYCDHDFPLRNSKLVPAGYQWRVKKLKRSRSVSPVHKKCISHRRKRSLSVTTDDKVLGSKVELVTDRIGRSKVVWPRSGPLHVELYPSRTIESTSVMHMNFMKRLLFDVKKEHIMHNVVAVADGGPDWSVKGVPNLMVFGFLWEMLELDTFVIQCYAPGHSRFNPIERSWSHLTKWIVSVILPVEIEELNFTIPTATEGEKWNIILDNAVKECAKFWHGKKFENFPVNVHQFLTNNENIANIKQVHSLLHSFSNATLSKLKKSTELLYLQEKYKMFVRHCNRKAYQIEFVRCQSTTCSHCTKLPCRENDFLEVMRNFGGTLPTPTLSEIHQNHYKSLSDMLRLNVSTSVSVKKEITSTTNIGVCPYKECCYPFYSKADKARHYLLMGHPIPPEDKRKRKTPAKVSKRKQKNIK